MSYHDRYWLVTVCIRGDFIVLLHSLGNQAAVNMQHDQIFQIFELYNNNVMHGLPEDGGKVGWMYKDISSRMNQKVLGCIGRWIWLIGCWSSTP